jgi:arylsulfatase A-like enzyme
METNNNITRRLAIQQGVAAAAALSIHGTALAKTKAAAAPSTEKMNVLFIAIDDLRPELNCYGHTWIKSPNVDALAKSGVLFKHAYVQQAVCSPSRTSLLTGTRPDTNKVWDLVTHFRRALPKVETIPEHFKNNGYFVQGVGKIFHPAVEDPQSWSVPWWTADKAPIYANNYHASVAGTPHDDDIERGKSKSGPAFECGAIGDKSVEDNFYKDGQVADRAVKLLGEISKKSEPFFFAVGFSKPHLPFVSPKKYWDLYDESTIKLADNPYHPKGSPDYACIGTSELRMYYGIPDAGPMPDNLARQLRHGYYASVSYTDAQIGKVIAELDRLDLRKNTIIILWGDHGWKLGEHGEWTKHTNVELDTNAPMMISLPGMKNAGVQCDALVEFVDMYPTLCELTGLPLPAWLEGTSFTPLLANPKQPWKTGAFSQYPRGHGKAEKMGYTMRTADYRFTIWVSSADHNVVDAIELFDHKVDSEENQNVAALPENAALVKKLTEQWKANWQGAKANLPGQKPSTTKVAARAASQWEAVSA